MYPSFVETLKYRELINTVEPENEFNPFQRLTRYAGNTFSHNLYENWNNCLQVK